MKSKIFKNLIFVVLAFSVCFSFLSLSANAVTGDVVVQYSCAEPVISDSSGYFIYFTRTNSGEIKSRMFAWDSWRALYSGDEVVPDSHISFLINIKSDLIELYPVDLDKYTTFYSIMDISSNSNNFNQCLYGTADTDNNSFNPYVLDFPTNETFIGYSIYGNGLIGENAYPNKREVFPVLFDDSATQYNQLNELLQKISILCADNQVIMGRLYDIMISAQNMEMLLTDMFNLLINIDYYVYDSNQVLYEVLDRLERLLDEMNIDVPDDLDNNLNNNPFDENANNFNPEQSFDDLPQFEFGNGLKSGFGVFRSIFDNIMNAFPGLFNVLTIILILGFVGYVLGRKLNKGG